MKKTLFFLSVFLIWVEVRADGLPPGVPNPIGPDGRTTSALFFTTEAYQKEALRLVLHEATAAARDLHLPEKLPIEEKDLTGAFINAFGFAYAEKMIGNVTTTNYSYNIAKGNKLSDVTIANMDQHCQEFREKYRVPVMQLNTNVAYQMATQLLRAAHMDVNALEKECQVQVQVNSFWNGLAPGEKLKGKTFVPIYDVTWTSSKNRAEQYGDTAYVCLFVPTKTLLDLNVRDAKYILRRTLEFTNLDVLLLGTNASKVSKAFSNMPAGQFPPHITAPIQLIRQIAKADHIVCTNFLRAEGDRPVRLAVAGKRTKSIVKAISSAERLQVGTNSMWDWELQFYAGTNLLVAVRFQGKVFLADGGEFIDKTGELEKLYEEAITSPTPKLLNVWSASFSFLPSLIVRLFHLRDTEWAGDFGEPCGPQCELADTFPGLFSAVSQRRLRFPGSWWDLSPLPFGFLSPCFSTPSVRPCPWFGLQSSRSALPWPTPIGCITRTWRRDLGWGGPRRLEPLEDAALVVEFGRDDAPGHLDAEDRIAPALIYLVPRVGLTMSFSPERSCRRTA